VRQGTGHRARRVRRSPDRLPLRRRAWQPSPLQAWRWPGLRVPAPLPRLGVAPRCRPRRWGQARLRRPRLSRHVAHPARPATASPLDALACPAALAPRPGVGPHAQAPTGCARRAPRASHALALPCRARTTGRGAPSRGGARPPWAARAPRAPPGGPPGPRLTPAAPAALPHGPARPTRQGAPPERGRASCPGGCPLPPARGPLALQPSRRLDGLLVRPGAQTLPDSAGAPTPRGAEIGGRAVLPPGAHPCPSPPLHGVLPAGGVAADGTRWGPGRPLASAPSGSSRAAPARPWRRPTRRAPGPGRVVGGHASRPPPGRRASRRGATRPGGATPPNLAGLPRLSCRPWPAPRLVGRSRPTAAWPWPTARGPGARRTTRAATACALSRSRPWHAGGGGGSTARHAAATGGGPAAAWRSAGARSHARPAARCWGTAGALWPRQRRGTGRRPRCSRGSPAPRGRSVSPGGGRGANRGRDSRQGGTWRGPGPAGTRPSGASPGQGRVCPGPPAWPAWSGVGRPPAPTRPRDCSERATQEAGAGPGTGRCALHAPLLPTGSPRLQRSNRPSPLNHRHSLRGLDLLYLPA